MHLREATTEDFGPAAELARRAFDMAVAPHYSSEGVATFHAYASEAALRTRDADGHLTVVAVVAGDIVGMAQVKAGTHLAMLFVLPEAQRRGIGRRLVEFLLTMSGPGELTVNASPNAEPAYLRFGFRRMSEEQVKDGIRFIPMQRPRLPAPR